MDDPTKISDVHVGVNAKISLLANPNESSEGIVHKILSEGDDTQGVVVVLDNGKKGRVVQIINSIEIIKHRILSENQYSENKEIFGDDVMRHEVIPKTVQSFLNSEGGFLYIGVRDTGTLEERLVGLCYDRELVEKAKGEKLPDDKFEDYLEMEIIDVLNKYLTSDNTIGPLVSINFPEIIGTKILEIHVTKSGGPFFFKHLTRRNVLKKFEIKFNNESAGQRYLDDFYIRSGGKKKLLETQEEFYNYFKIRFQKFKTDL